MGSREWKRGGRCAARAQGTLAAADLVGGVVVGSGRGAKGWKASHQGRRGTSCCCHQGNVQAANVHTVRQLCVHLFTLPRP